jgi:hypothetical protein
MDCLFPRAVHTDDATVETLAGSRRTQLVLRSPLVRPNGQKPTCEAKSSQAVFAAERACKKRMKLKRLMENRGTCRSYTGN